MPGLKVTLSCPIVRADNKLANEKILHVRNKLKRNGINIIENRNITFEHLGKKGLHMTPRGTGRLAMNLIAYIQRL